MRGALAGLALLAGVEGCSVPMSEMIRGPENEVRAAQCDPAHVAFDVGRRCRANDAMAVMNEEAGREAGKEGREAEVSLEQARAVLAKLQAGFKRLQDLKLTAQFFFEDGKKVRRTEMSDAVRFKDGDRYYSLFGGVGEDFSSFTVERLAGNPFLGDGKFVPTVDHSKLVWTAEGQDFEITLTVDGERVASISVVADTIISASNSAPLARFVERFMGALQENAGRGARRDVNSF